MKKELGQYFTVSENLQKFVYECVKNTEGKILEPSFGAGHLLQKFMMDTRHIVCYEIDKSVQPIVNFDSSRHIVKYADFLTSEFHDEKFDTIIGNPPYVKNTRGNLYIQFIEKCYELLSDTGEIVFIVPSDFIKCTRASKLIQDMTNHGTFTDFLFPNDEKLFENASVDIMVFRYQKGRVTNKTVLNGSEIEYSVTKGIITFGNKSGDMVSDFFDVRVGIVSGKDEVFKQSFGNIEVLTDKDKTEKFVCVSKFPSGDSTIDAHLLRNKSELINRKIKKFDERNWFEWGALRNIDKTQNDIGKKCIYVKTVTRSTEVAFEGTVQYFGGTLICMVPKKKINLKKVVEFLNSESFKKEYMYSGRFKIGQKQLTCLVLPA